ncbi:hypothetical protein NEOKW01_2015 [Nematocida sp. AWRm80]|nr:hypothetical protein NEOKW01_2015 [Nematocida sp. AWRm80]
MRYSLKRHILQKAVIKSVLCAILLGQIVLCRPLLKKARYTRLIEDIMIENESLDVPIKEKVLLSGAVQYVHIQFYKNLTDITAVRRIYNIVSQTKDEVGKPLSEVYQEDKKAYAFITSSIFNIRCGYIDMSRFKFVYDADQETVIVIKNRQAMENDIVNILDIPNKDRETHICIEGYTTSTSEENMFSVETGKNIINRVKDETSLHLHALALKALDPYAVEVFSKVFKYYYKGYEIDVDNTVIVDSCMISNLKSIASHHFVPGRTCLMLRGDMPLSISMVELYKLGPKAIDISEIYVSNEIKKNIKVDLNPINIFSEKDAVLTKSFAAPKILYIRLQDLINMAKYYNSKPDLSLFFEQIYVTDINLTATIQDQIKTLKQHNLNSLNLNSITKSLLLDVIYSNETITFCHIMNAELFNIISLLKTDQLIAINFLIRFCNAKKELVSYKKKLKIAMNVLYIQLNDVSVANICNTVVAVIVKKEPVHRSSDLDNNSFMFSYTYHMYHPNKLTQENTAVLMSIDDYMQLAQKDSVKYIANNEPVLMDATINSIRSKYDSCKRSNKGMFICPRPCQRVIKFTNKDGGLKRKIKDKSKKLRLLSKLKRTSSTDKLLSQDNISSNICSDSIDCPEDTDDAISQVIIDIRTEHCCTRCYPELYKQQLMTLSKNKEKQDLFKIQHSFALLKQVNSKALQITMFDEKMIDFFVHFSQAYHMCYVLVEDANRDTGKSSIKGIEKYVNLS